MKWRFWSAMGVSALHVMLIVGCGSNSGGSSSDSVSATAAACISCHSSAVSPVTGLVIATEWQASTHSTQNAASCYDCHEPDPTHPSNCNQCHGGGTLSTDSARHDVSTNPDADDKCKKCHGIEATRAQSGSVYGFSTAALYRAHFNNVTASFVSTRYKKNCRKCHNPHNPTGHIAINQEWKASGHGNNYARPWNYTDFKTRGTAGADPATSVATQCVRCHTATGYINYVSSNFTDISPWGLAEYNQTPRDRTKQVLACNACHDDGNGNTYAFKRRSVPQVTAYYAYSTGATKKFVLSHQFPDLATSNICMSCHAGREIGAVISEAKNRGFGNFSTSLINSHYLTGGATVFKISGYEYSGRSYENYSNYAHDIIGIGNHNGTGGDGPCVTCHLKPKRHSFLPVVKSGTTITSVVSTVCAICHPGGWQGVNPTTGYLYLQDKKAGYLAAIEALKQQIKAKNYNVNSTGSQDWERVYGSAGGPNTMGAFFNYYLLSHDYGGFAHNSRYVKRLLHDSIDWMYDGVLDADDVEVAINLLGALTAQQKSDAINYILGGSGGGRP